MTQAFVEHNESASSQKPGMEEANIALQVGYDSLRLVK